MSKISITLTGADKRTRLDDLVKLADAGAEIAFLYTLSPDGRHRYPWLNWIFSNANLIGAQHCALHICGSRARADFDKYYHHFPKFGRIQINGRVPPVDLVNFCESDCPKQTVITQHNFDNEHLVTLPLANHAVLVDVSGGRGIAPESWARPQTSKRVGFAGGLRAANLTAQLDRIAAVAGDDFWIDLETGLRDQDDWFSVSKAYEVVDLFQSWLTKRD